MYHRQPEFIDRFWSLVTRAVGAGQRHSGLGKPVDDAIEALRNAGSDSESADGARHNSEWELINCLYETLGGLPGVETDYWEFDGGGPGTSTCGRNYWATDVEAALERLAAELGLPEGAT